MYIHVRRLFVEFLFFFIDEEIIHRKSPSTLTKHIKAKQSVITVYIINADRLETYEVRICIFIFFLSFLIFIFWKLFSFSKD